MPPPESTTSPSPLLPSSRVLAWLGREFLPYRWRIAAFLLLLALMTALGLSGPLLIRRAVNVHILGKDYEGLLRVAGLFLAVQMLNIGVRFTLVTGMERMGQRILAGLRVRLFRHVLGQGQAFFNEHPVGRLMSRVESDVDALRRFFTSAAVEMIATMTLCTGMIGVMLWVDPRMTGVLGLVLLPFGPYLAALNRKVAPIIFEERRLAGEVSATLTEYLHGTETVQVFGQERFAADLVRERNQALFRRQFLAAVIWTTMFGSLHFFKIGAFAALLWYGGRRVSAGTLQVGDIILFLGYLHRFFEPLHHLAQHFQEFQRAFAGARRVIELFGTQPTVQEPSQPKPWPGLREGITFENVWFSYDDREWVLRDAHFHIPAGQHWALVGRTGSGKTTIVNLLFRFYDPQRGRILIDGVDIREMRLEELRRNLGLVLQDIQLFPGTVRENLRFHQPAVSDERIEAAARLVQAHEFICALPQGYDTVLGEGGGTLSVGQRQLLSFARALVGDPALVVLDEATSTVDPQTERLIQHGLRELLHGRTSVTIAHRLSTIRSADCVVVLDKGSILELGPPQELLGRDGAFARLHAMQQTLLDAGEER